MLLFQVIVLVILVNVSVIPSTLVLVNVLDIIVVVTVLIIQEIVLEFVIV